RKKLHTRGPFSPRAATLHSSAWEQDRCCGHWRPHSGRIKLFSASESNPTRSACYLRPLRRSGLHGNWTTQYSRNSDILLTTKADFATTDCMPTKSRSNCFERATKSDL